MPNGQNDAENTPESHTEVVDDAPDEHDVDELDEYEDEEDEEPDPFADLIRGMDAGERLIVKRTGPSSLPQSLRGYMETLELSPGAEAPDIFDLIKARWGGGTYTVQRAARAGAKRKGFVKGAAVLHIGGEPLYEGRSTNPRTGDISPRVEQKPPTRVEYVPAPAPAPAPVVNPDPGVVGALTQALVKARAGEGLGLADLLTLAQQMQQPNPTPQPRTPVSELREQVRFLGELKDLLGSGGEGGSSESSGPEVPKSIEDAFMQFFKHQGAGALFGGGEQPAQPQHGVPASGPPGALWDPQRRIWVWPQPPPQAQPPPQPQPEPEPEDEWDEEPITPEMVAERLQQLDATERREFVAALQRTLGPNVVETFTRSMGES